MKTSLAYLLRELDKSPEKQNRIEIDARLWIIYALLDRYGEQAWDQLDPEHVKLVKSLGYKYEPEKSYKGKKGSTWSLSRLTTGMKSLMNGL